MTQPLMLREKYAKERTLLALDRTFLSYLRTSMAVIVVGVTFVKFFDSTTFQTAGFILIIVAFFLTAFGTVRAV